jgi:predicted nucleic acid-binding protein
MSEDVVATCDEIDAEIVRVLTENFSWEQHRATSALQAILARSIRVKIRGAVKECHDPGDDMFLECAALAKVDLLVAEDKDLLTLGAYKGTRIVAPSEYLRAG